ncbi:MAG: superoxide dismutase [Cu-Zn] SodC [Cyanobacteria bacterium P01_C01_bin.70]
MKVVRTVLGLAATTLALVITLAPTVRACETRVMLNLTSATGVGESIGIVMLQDSEYGLLLTPDLMGIVPGIHGFHIHMHPDCGPTEKDGETVPGLAAGDHYDPEATGNHEGPYKAGHLGDLPPLYADETGNATVPVLAPRLTIEMVKGRSLIVHRNGDNFSDDPKPLGGGGPRLACGVID